MSAAAEASPAAVAASLEDAAVTRVTKVWLMSPDKPNIQVLRVTDDQWTEANRQKWLRCTNVGTKSFGPNLDDRLIVWYTRDDDEKALKLDMNKCAARMFKGCSTMKDNLDGYMLVTQKSKAKSDDESKWVDMAFAPKDFIAHCRTYATQDADVDWEREYDMAHHDEAVMAHHREFRKILLKYGLNTEDKAGELADFLTDASSGGNINPVEFATKHKLEVDEAHTLLSFINVGVDFKKKNLGAKGDVMSALKKQQAQVL